MTGQPSQRGDGQIFRVQTPDGLLSRPMLHGAHLIIALLILFTTLSGSSDTLANTAKRVALVVGNSTYENVTALPNPRNDAEEMAAELRKLGFTVKLLKDVGRNSLRDALGEFSNAAVGAEIGVVFFAGHGIEVGRQNYLLPIDAKLETDLRVRFEAVSLDDVLASLEGVTGIRIVMLDACRNNPFISSIKVTTANRSISRGLSKVEPSVGTLVSFAAKEGTTAADGVGKHSPYTTAVLNNLDQPGLEVNKLFRLVRDDVLAATGGDQEPYTYGSTSGADVFLKEQMKEPPKGIVPVTPAVPAADLILTDFQLAKEIGTEEAWRAFLEKHGNMKSNFYVDLAVSALKKLKIPTIPTVGTNSNSSINSEALTKPAEKPDTASRPKKVLPKAKQEQQEQKKASLPAVDTKKSKGEKSKPKGSRPSAYEYSFTIWRKNMLIPQTGKYAKTPYGGLRCNHGGTGMVSRICSWVE